MECDEIKIDSGTLSATSEKLDVYNPWPVALPGDYYLVAVQEQTTLQWLAQFPGVLDVRWVDPKLEQTSNGTYTTIDTAVDCT